MTDEECIQGIALLKSFDEAVKEMQNQRLRRRRVTYRQQDVEPVLQLAARLADFLDERIQTENPRPATE